MSGRKTKSTRKKGGVETMLAELELWGGQEAEVELGGKAAAIVDYMSSKPAVFGALLTQTEYDLAKKRSMMADMYRMCEDALAEEEEYDGNEAKQAKFMFDLIAYHGQLSFSEPSVKINRPMPTTTATGKKKRTFEFMANGQGKMYHDFFVDVCQSKYQKVVKADWVAQVYYSALSQVYLASYAAKMGPTLGMTDKMFDLLEPFPTVLEKVAGFWETEPLHYQTGNLYSATLSCMVESYAIGIVTDKFTDDQEEDAKEILNQAKYIKYKVGRDITAWDGARAPAHKTFLKMFINTVVKPVHRVAVRDLAIRLGLVRPKAKASAPKPSADVELAQVGSDGEDAEEGLL